MEQEAPRAGRCDILRDTLPMTLSLPLRLIGTIAGIVVCLAVPASAADSQDERASLAGLKAISIVVEEVSPAAAPSGLTTNILQTDVERRVKAAGIPVTPDADAYLYVHVSIADAGSSLPLPYFVSVSLMQEVTLPRGIKTRTPLQVPTWSLERIGLASTGVLRVNVVGRVDEFVDQFIKAYQSVNPK
jgi:hypothetical protein